MNGKLFQHIYDIIVVYKMNNIRAYNTQIRTIFHGPDPDSANHAGRFESIYCYGLHPKIHMDTIMKQIVMLLQDDYIEIESAASERIFFKPKDENQAVKRYNELIENGLFVPQR